MISGVIISQNNKKEIAETIKSTPKNDQQLKAIRSDRKITPFGGVIPVLKQIKAFKIPQLIRESLGSRVKQAQYSYEDVIIAWMLTNLCGGLRLDHITKFKKSLNIIPELKLPSHDTLGRVMKSLSTELTVTQNTGHTADKRGHNKKSTFKRDQKASYIFTSTRETNENMALSRLLVKTTCNMDLLKPKTPYTLDMDATLIPTEITEAKMSYKRVNGFLPMVSSIGKLPIYIGMRNGNVSPTAEIKKNLEITLNLLNESNITIDKVRMDSAGYVSEVLDFIHDRNIKFYIGGQDKETATKAIEKQTTWLPFSLETATNFWECESADIDYTLYKGKHNYRLLVIRAKADKKRPAKWINKGNYHYKYIITNDWESSAEDIVRFYNQRGTSEQIFDTLKNDFAWRLPPFCGMAQNTVFLIIAALTNNVYQALIHKFNKHVNDIKLNAKLKEFIFTFMSVACEIIDDTYVFYNTDIAYEKIC